jgi:hypothetical protein
MSFDLGDALLAAANGALQQYGGQLQHQKDLDEAAAAAKAKEAYDRRMKAFGASLEPPKYQTFDTTENGVSGKKTVRSHYDEASGQTVEDDLGFVPNEAKAPTTRNVIMGAQEATQQFNPKTGAWENIGTPGPRFAPQQASPGGDRITFSEYQSMTPEERAAYRAYKAPGSAGGESAEDKADHAARVQTAAQLRDFNKLSRYEKIDALRAAGIDPGVADGDTKSPISAEALADYRNTLRDDNLTLMGVPLFKRASGGAASTAPLLNSAKPAPQSSGGKSPCPDGTKLKGPDGRMYVVKNGLPVLA